MTQRQPTAGSAGADAGVDADADGCAGVDGDAAPGAGRAVPEPY